MAVKDTPFVRGAEKIARRIATIRANYGVAAFTDEIGDLILRRTLQRFDDEVDPDGKPWLPLSPATLRRKRALGYANRGKLKRTLALRNSIRRIRGSAGSVYTNTGASVRIGVEDPKVREYGRIQNYGDGKRIPARRFLGIGASDLKAVDAFLRRKAKQIERDWET